jgi:hypothetical protein
MNAVMITDLLRNEGLDRNAMDTTRGGMMKRPFQSASIGNLLTDQLGDPVAVYVDGVLINSPSTGYAPK